MSDKQQIGRLAMRVEGDMWNAYYALPDTMKDALLLGSIRMAIVQNKDRKHIFMELMKDAVGEMIAEKTGGVVSWPDGPKSAPGHERGGNA